MASTIRLTVITGPHRGQRFCFRGKMDCTAGRASDCFVQLSGEARDRTISRHHCELDVDVPFIRVNDLGSSNGTFINGKSVEPISKDAPELVPCCDAGCPGAILTNGDVLTIGGTSLRVEVVDCPPPQEADEKDPPIWDPDQIAKKNCNILC